MKHYPLLFSFSFHKSLSNRISNSSSFDDIFRLTFFFHAFLFDEEKKHRRDNDFCEYCDTKDHFADFCSNKKPFFMINQISFFSSYSISSKNSSSQQS